MLKSLALCAVLSEEIAVAQWFSPDPSDAPRLDYASALKVTGQGDADAVMSAVIKARQEVAEMSWAEMKNTDAECRERFAYLD